MNRLTSAVSHRTGLLALALALGATACTPFALSPPARTLPLESSATLHEGDVAIQASGGVHRAVGSAGGSAGARVRYGAHEYVEAQAEVGYAYVDYGDARSPHLGSGRAGLKLAPIEYVAFVVGLGAGGHEHGGFIAPDLGIVVGYENQYVIPWVALRGTISAPIGPSTTTIVQPRDDGTGMVDTFVLVPPNTAAWQLSIGVRVPVSIDEPRGTRMNLLAGGGITQMYGLEGTDQHGFWQAEFGVELVLDP